jgi:hypothetical protein
VRMRLCVCVRACVHSCIIEFQLRQAYWFASNGAFRNPFHSTASYECFRSINSVSQYT